MELSHRFLIESALLTHGLISVSDDAMRAAWPDDLDCIAWVDSGRPVIGGMADYLPFRARAASLCRIDCDTLASAMEDGVSGALTASGTMALCRTLGISLAVTCGMGGIGDIRGEELCPDLPALRDIPVTLIAAAPKDVVDIPATLRWLRENDVRVLGADVPSCTGYLFRCADEPLDGMAGECLPAPPGRLLILNGLPLSERIADSSLLPQGIAAGKAAEAAGRYYHPAANAAFDVLTNGASSRAQLRALIANALLARRMTTA